MVDTDKPDDQNPERVTFAQVYVPGRGLVIMDVDKLDEGLARIEVEESRVILCFIVRGTEEDQQWNHFYSVVVDEDMAKTLRSEGIAPGPLSFSIQGGGALVIEHEDDGFVRAYGPGTWKRVQRFGEEFIEVEGEDSSSIK
ncbi:hypothetical protein M3D91_011385 [Micrococcus luteus]|nr:hypothetical protein [Micrococcus luteus]